MFFILEKRRVVRELRVYNVKVKNVFLGSGLANFV